MTATPERRVAPDPPDDGDLVTAARAGDRDALDRLLRLHQPRLYLLCRRITGNDADAMDATQEALIAIVRGLSRFDGRARFSTWAYRIATNASLDELRRRRRRPVVAGEPADHPEPVAGGSGPDDVVVARLLVDDALAALPPEFRTAVVLRDVCELDYAEIAEVLDVPAGTVRSRIARGRGQLADRLGNQDSPAERPSSAP